MNINDLRDPRAYTAAWMAFNGVEVTASGVLKGKFGPPLLSSMILDHHEEVKVLNIKLRQAHFESGKSGPPDKVKPIPKILLEYAWNDYPVKRKEEARKKLIAEVTPFIAPSDEIKRWLTAVTGSASEVEVAVMRHFIWQIKRKMLKLPVVYHICPVFFGKQGGGKTTSIQKLFGAAQDAVLELGPDEATDSRAKAAFSENYICFFDEMANMARVEMESLKRLITSSQLSYRPMNTNEVRTVEQNCSFIGASNKSIQEVVYDPTGLRRFYEFTCLDLCDFNTINSINYAAIWGDIDPSLDRGYTAGFLEALVSHQTDRVTEDEVTHFIREMGVTASGPVKEITANALYASYINWRVQAGYSAKPALVTSTFGARLATHRIGKKIRKIDGYQKTIYEVSASSTVFNTQLVSVKGGLT